MLPKNTFAHTLLRISILVLFTYVSSQAQSDMPKGDQKFSSVVYITETYDNEFRRWTIPGLMYELGYHASKNLDFDLRFGFMNWGGYNNRLMIPLEVGPSYTLNSNDLLRVSILANIGPSIIVGNDYGSLFAIGNTGIDLTRHAQNGHNLSFQVTLGQGMLFHPDHFSFTKIGIGYKL